MPRKKAIISSEEPALYREFEHTGDLGIELSAPTRAELFRRAAVALASLLVDTATVEPREDRKIDIAGEADPDLMHDLLAELLNVFLADGFIWRDASVGEASGSLNVTIRGESFDPDRHGFRREIKGVTYHQLMVEKSDDGWRARVILDV